MKSGGKYYKLSADLYRSSLLPYSYVSEWSSLFLHTPGPVPRPRVPSAVSGYFTSCFIVEMAEKSQPNAVLAVDNVGEQEEENFPKSRAGFATSEFGVLSSLVVGRREGRKRKGKEIGSYLF